MKKYILVIGAVVLVSVLLVGCTDLPDWIPGTNLESYEETISLTGGTSTMIKVPDTFPVTPVEEVLIDSGLMSQGDISCNQIPIIWHYNQATNTWSSWIDINDANFLGFKGGESYQVQAFADCDLIFKWEA